MTHTPTRLSAVFTKISLVVAGAALLAACGTSKPEPEVDMTALRVQCEKESGFSGSSQLVPETGTVFVWRADGEKVAQCENGTLVDIY